VRAIWHLANAYVTDAAPWMALASDPARAAVALHAALGLLEVSARVAGAFVPETAGRVLRALGLPDAAAPGWPSSGADAIAGPPAGRHPGDPGPLIRKIGPKEVTHLRARFAAHLPAVAG
jgi:methionyl-tRNA synthetase